MDHHVYAINAQNGNLIWDEDLGAAVLDTPTETEDLIIVGTFSNQLVALDKARGAVVWSFDTEAWVWGNPLVLDGTAYFGDIDGNVYFVSVESGRESKNPVDLESAITSSPVASEELIYFATESGTLFARTPSDFGPGWKEDLGGGLFVKPIIQDERIFFSVNSEEYQLLALETDTDDTIWEFTPTEE
jgi:outer membrane protein assembly factor BamB